MDALNGIDCLVVGGGGFLGSAIARKLAEKGARVQAFGRSIRIPEALDPRVQWQAGEIEDRATLVAGLAGSDIVYYLAGEANAAHAGSGRHGGLGASVDLLTVLELCREAGTRKFVFASSGGTVYGLASSQPIAESAPTNPISLYGAQKLFGEKLLEVSRAQWGLDYRVLRVANPFGPYQSPLRPQGLIAKAAFRALRGETIEIWGSGQVVRDFLFIEDVAEAFVAAAIYDGPHRVMNVGSGQGRSITEVLQGIEAVLGRSVSAINVLGRHLDVPSNVLDSHLIFAETGWSPRVEWNEALRRTIHWMDSNLQQFVG